MLLSSSQDILQALCHSLERGEEVYLATVISTWGSSPRPPGAMMIWSRQSGVVGSVSGGCVEEDLIARLGNGKFDNHFPCEIPYGETNGDDQSLQLPCGGILRVLLEKPGSNDLTCWQAVLDLLSQRQGISRVVDTSIGQWQFETSPPHKLRYEDGCLNTYLGPTRKLLIVGANQISYYLANYAQSLDFDVSICDPGEALSSQWQADDFEFLQCYPDGLIEKRFADYNSAVVAVSHDPRLDDMAILEALPSNAFYVGVMGSLKTTEARLQRLRQLEMPEALLQKLKAPVGLSIGSKTPAEIAMSIAAHLVEQYAKDTP